MIRRWLTAASVTAVLFSSGSAPAANAAQAAVPTTDKLLIDSASRGVHLVPATALETPRPTKDTVSPPARSPLDRIELQDFIRASLGRDLPLYGYELFEGVPETFAPLANVPVPADYVIGPGDEIVVQAWGQIDVDYRAEVDRNGTLYLPKIGSIRVAGVKQENLYGHMKAAIGRYYKNFELSVALGQLRSIQIYVVGQARRPGAYTVGSLSSLVNALFASGGPSAKGSMRRIQLKRGQRVVTEFDLYDLLLHGDRSRDAQLLPGDVIFIPPTLPRAAVTGSVNGPAIFELKPKETLGDLIEFAGGLSPTASGQRVTVERIVERSRRKVEEIALDSSGLAQRLHDGDLVQVYAVSPKLDQIVTLRGNVAQTMRFPWREGMRIRDVIPSKEFLLAPEYWVQQNAAGRYENWISKEAGNLVQKEPRARARSQEQLKVQVKETQADINWEYAIIERQNPKDLSTELVPFNPRLAIIEGKAEDNLLLQPGDVITILSQKDIQLPVDKQTRFIRIEGEVQRPGVYQIQPGETLRQALSRAEGPTRQAHLYGAELYRDSTRALQQKRLDEALDRLERMIEQNSLTRSQSATTPDETAGLKVQIEAQRVLVARLRGAKAEGRIVLESAPDARWTEDLPNIALEDGDRLVIPTRPSVVNVLGEVYNQNAFIYRPGKRVADYLDLAGGPTRDGDSDNVYVLKADGSVIAKRQSAWLFGNFDATEVLPGDSVVVPVQLERFSFTKELKDWTQILYQFALGVAGLKVLNNL